MKMEKIKMEKWVEGYFNRLITAYDNSDAKNELIKYKELVEGVRRKKGKIILCGNGASNTIGTHGAVDFTNQLGIPSFSINDSAFLTAAANDFGYENVFERAVNLFLDSNDIIICISSSGSSPNAINAAKAGKKLGASVITFSGFKPDNKLRKLGDVNFYVDNNEYNIVESIHNAWLVCVIDMIISENPDSVGVHGLEFGVKGKVY
jgi:D-sedoheptulose 7-phosphate isomerase